MNYSKEFQLTYDLKHDQNKNGPFCEQKGVHANPFSFSF